MIKRGLWNRRIQSPNINSIQKRASSKEVTLQLISVFPQLQNKLEENFIEIYTSLTPDKHDAPRRSVVEPPSGFGMDVWINVKRTRNTSMFETTKPILGMILATAVVGAGLTSTQAAELKFEHVMSIGTKGDDLGQFGYVEDFDIASNGQHILVTDAAHAFVQVFDKTTGEFVSRFGGKGDDDANLDKPEGISVAPNGDIYVADYNTGDVKVYDKNYNWKFTFSEYGSEPGQNIKSEFTDIRDGLYYMPEAGNHRVSVWDLEGNFKFLFGGSGTAEGKMNNPEASKFNSEGHLYVSDLKNDRMQVFDAEGNFLFAWGSSGSEPGQFKAPAGVAIDKDDNVYVSEIGNDRMQVFDKKGNLLAIWGSEGSGDGQFDNLHGVFVDQETGWLYIADTGNDRVQVYKPAGGSSS